MSESTVKSSPYLPVQNSVQAVMLSVVLALIPGTIAQVYFFGTGVVLNILLATATAFACEAAMLQLRKRPLMPFLSDGSALLTAVLLALALPPLLPWWIPVFGTAFAIIVAKHLYGGLGYNPFNPAMIGYAMLLISFPREMTTWLTPVAGGGMYSFNEFLEYSFYHLLPGNTNVDAISQATPMDTLKTGLGLNREIGQIHAETPVIFSRVSGLGWEWINAWFLIGGIWLIRRRVIAWQIPLGFLVSLASLALVFWLIDDQQYSSPMFHLFSGAAMLGAFFIATDPVTASTTPSGRLVYGAGIGILVYVIRVWGGYPDGVAFGVILMNLAAPTIDYYFRPRVFGEQQR